MKSHFYRLSLLGAVLGALTLNTALADDAATQSVSVRNITVSYADLNLAVSADLASLYRRVKWAERSVCDVRTMKVPIEIVLRNRECVSGAINGAIGEINHVRLTALHQTKLLEERQS